MNSKTKILIIILIGVLVAGGFISVLNWKHYSKPTLPLKHYCQTDSDCVLSGNDPEGFGICVNKEWYEEWEKNPESKKYKWECEYTGKERCACVNNKCQRIDSERGCGVKETQVTITTDKTEYEQGDTVIITIQNKGRKKVEICGLSKCAGLATLHTNVEEYKEGEWRAITGYCPTVGFKREKNSIVKDDLLCYSLAPKDLLTFSIPSFLSYYKIDKSKRVRVVCYIDNKESPIYSNEFIIKEKSEGVLSDTEPPSTLLLIIPEKNQRGDFIELTGRIYSMGNPPVIQLGVETLDGEVYGIVGERTKELWKFRDKTLHLKGYLAGRTPRTKKSIEVIDYRVIK